MELKLIDQKAHARMKEALDDFCREIRKLCANPDFDNIWMNNQDVCLLLNISKRTLQHYRDSGKLSFSMIGQKCYYKVADVEKLIAKS